MYPAAMSSRAGIAVAVAGVTTFDDPNRESLGLSPIWTGAGDEPAPPEEDAPDEPAEEDAS